MIRRVFVFIHRWAGLTMAGFLTVVGLTGSLLAFYSELNHWLSPRLNPGPHGAELSPAILALRAEALVPYARTNTVYVGETGKAEIGMEPRPGAAETLDFEQLVLDSVTGAELGRVTAQNLPQSWDDVMPFVYRLHYALAIGSIGSWILGIVALAWTIDCFVGFYLTIPAGGSSFWQRWKPAWNVKWNASAYRLNFDLHRAFGLWLWAMLFIFAWSGVGFNLNSVYMGVSRLLFDFSPSETSAPPLKEPVSQPALGWLEAQLTGEKLMADEARRHDFTTGRVMALYLDRTTGTYEYRIRSSRDIDERYGSTAVFFDASSGELKKLSLPSGERSGDTITAWLAGLHMGHVFGVPYRIFVCISGLAVAMLSITGVYIWWKKRRARKISRARRAAAAEPQLMEPAE